MPLLFARNGKIAWFPDEHVIRMIGPKCFQTLNPEGHCEAVAQFVREEAAVLYVGMTRARDLLYPSYSEIDRHGKHMSRSSFINLIAKSCDFAEFRRQRWKI